MSNDKPKMGDLLQADVATFRYELARRGFLDPETAAKRTLATFLRRVVFVVEPGDDGVCAPFNLNDVFEEWPEPKEELNRPAASVVTATSPYLAHNFAPTVLEQTANCFGDNTVLWKTDEMQLDLQIDFWVTNAPERSAIAARLPEVFNLTESRSGILVQGPCEYFDRTVRFSLINTNRPDTSESTFERERRLTQTVRADIDVVQLRLIKPLIPRPMIDGEPVGLDPNSLVD